jgi:AcrR family transcriptional regulator
VLVALSSGVVAARARTQRSAKPTGRGRPSGAHGEATRRNVVAAARRAFAVQGFSGATMRGIAADAGLTAMALYNYAPSKAALFELVWQDSVDTIYADYEDVIASRDSLFEEVELLLDRSREILRNDPDHIQFVLRLLTERDHAGLRDLNLEVGRATDFFAQLAERSVQRGEIDETDRDALVRYITTLLWGITTLTALEPENLDQTVDATKWAIRHHPLVDGRALDTPTVNH